jgi:hypothetical protein
MGACTGISGGNMPRQRTAKGIRVEVMRAAAPLVLARMAYDPVINAKNACLLPSRVPPRGGRVAGAGVFWLNALAVLSAHLQFGGYS